MDYVKLILHILKLVPLILTFVNPQFFPVLVPLSHPAANFVLPL